MKQTKKRLLKRFRDAAKKLPLSFYVVNEKKMAVNHYQKLKDAYLSGGMDAVNDYVLKYRPDIGKMLEGMKK